MRFEIAALASIASIGKAAAADQEVPNQSQHLLYRRLPHSSLHTSLLVEEEEEAIQKIRTQTQRRRPQQISQQQQQLLLLETKAEGRNNAQHAVVSEHKELRNSPRSNNKFFENEINNNNNNEGTSYSSSSSSSSDDNFFEICNVGILDNNNNNNNNNRRRNCSSDDDVCVLLNRFEQGDDEYDYAYNTYLPMNHLSEEERKGLGICVHNNNNNNNSYSLDAAVAVAAHDYHYDHDHDESSSQQVYGVVGGDIGGRVDDVGGVGGVDAHHADSQQQQHAHLYNGSSSMLRKTTRDLELDTTPTLFRQRRLGTDCAAFCSNYPIPEITESGPAFRMLIMSCIDPRAAGIDCPHIYSPFNCWDVSRVKDMTSAFRYQMFNYPLDCWDVSSVTDMKLMFHSTYYFNQNINTWDVSKVRNTMRMFNYAPQFNQPVGAWDTSSVTHMYQMFDNAYLFNQPIGDWDTSSVERMDGMFSRSSFNQQISNWNVGKVTDMKRMFYACDDFNQNINDWEVSTVGDMEQMFYMATVFDQCLSSWGDKAPVGAEVNNMFFFSSCPSTKDPNPGTKGPWCRTFNQGCGEKPKEPCENDFTFLTETGSAMTCNSLVFLKKSQVNKYCRSDATTANAACPTFCNPRCNCSDKKKFKIKSNEYNDFNGKYKCKNVGKPGQPGCLDRINKAGVLLVRQMCVSKCEYCLPSA